MLRLQRAAGNRAVARLVSGAADQAGPRRSLQREEAAIPVHKGSTLSAGQFLDKLKKNKQVPAWLKKGLGSSAGALAITGDITAPEDRIWMFVDSFKDAFRSRTWEMTTAKSSIEVKAASGKGQTWSQIVTPDLSPKERIGSWMKVGRDEQEFSPTTLHSETEEIIYGWTEPDTATNLRREKRGMIVIVTEIEVTAPSGRKKVFKPGADTVAEAILHEISVHAGRISEGKPDVHRDTDSAVRDVVEQVAGFFRSTNAAGELQPSALTKEIFAFVGEP